jgi:hypothetical protein
MKKKILRSAVGLIILAAFTFPACEFLEDCMTCELVTDDGSGDPTISTPLIFCGEALQEKLDAGEVTIGGVTTYWNCY